MTDRPTVLVTNDDGVAAPGLRWLAAAAHEYGLRVVVAAPQRDASGMSAALTAVTEGGRILVERVALPGLDGIPAYGVVASPGYIVLLAGLGAFGTVPSAVLAGINRGANAGRAILHSGTVGAALTAANHGGRAMAVSLDVLGGAPSGGDGAGAATAPPDDEPRHWDSAAAWVRHLLPGLLDAPAGTVLNLNVPDRPPERIAGLRYATLAGSGQVRMSIAETGDGFVRVAIGAGGAPPVPGSDVALLADGYAAVTSIRGVTVAREGPEPPGTADRPAPATWRSGG